MLVRPELNSRPPARLPDAQPTEPPVAVRPDYVALKVSRLTGLIAKLRYFVPTHTLLTIYRSFIAPYLTYGLVAWGQASKSSLDKLLKLQKQSLRFIYFSNRNDCPFMLVLFQAKLWNEIPLSLRNLLKKYI